MPRTRKRTYSGDPAQRPSATAGQQYGKGVQEMALEKAMPAPNLNQAPSAPRQAPQQQPFSLQDALAQAQGLGGSGGLLQQPTGRPNEPLTAGLTQGPGPGPGVLSYPRATPTGAWMRMLAQTTGDPTLQEIADRANV